MVADGSFSHKIDYVQISEEILNFEGHLNLVIGSNVTAILVNGGILPSAGGSTGRVYVCIMRIRNSLV